MGGHRWACHAEGRPGPSDRGAGILGRIEVGLGALLTVAARRDADRVAGPVQGAGFAGTDVAVEHAADRGIAGEARAAVRDAADPARVVQPARLARGAGDFTGAGCLVARRACGAPPPARGDAGPVDEALVAPRAQRTATASFSARRARTEQNVARHAAGERAGLGPAARLAGGALRVRLAQHQAGADAAHARQVRRARGPASSRPFPVAGTARPGARRPRRGSSCVPWGQRSRGDGEVRGPRIPVSSQPDAGAGVLTGERPLADVAPRDGGGAVAGLVHDRPIAAVARLSTRATTRSDTRSND